ncbi:MAG: glycosyl transferase [Deltaproteobacteria bacterium GWC2_56_8]|nr:MAG: glycosyl transferase [Deltaproteobacteria bacterium GWC2_56_8]
MKVLLLNAWDSSGGAARAACRLLKGVREAGVDARMLVKDKSSHDPAVIAPKTADRIFGLLRPRFEGRMVRRYPQWNGLTFSPALLPDRLLHQVSELDPDVIHLHWMGDSFLRLETVARFGRPVVWTLHDSWPFTGGCHIPLQCTRYRESCGACPTLGSQRENDLSRKVWQRKSDSWQGLDLTIVAPSRWMADCARASSLFKKARIEVIPNGLDLEVYRPVDKTVAREALGLPKDKILILFGAKSATEDRNKGFHLLAQALGELPATTTPSSIELLLFGSQDTGVPGDIGFKTHSLGWFHDDLSLALLYAAADVFVMPSIQENLPYVVMEAMACGTPCVGFNQGGLPDLIDHMQNGYLAGSYDPRDLARGIEWVLENEGRRKELSVRAAEKVLREFSARKVVKLYIALYREILSTKP